MQGNFYEANFANFIHSFICNFHSFIAKGHAICSTISLPFSTAQKMNFSIKDFFSKCD